jgi:hypothetical protein
MKAWVKIQNEWYELLGIGQTLVGVLVGITPMTLPKSLVDGYRLA